MKFFISWSLCIPGNPLKIKITNTYVHKPFIIFKKALQVKNYFCYVLFDLIPKNIPTIEISKNLYNAKRRQPAWECDVVHLELNFNYILYIKLKIKVRFFIAVINVGHKSKFWWPFIFAFVVTQNFVSFYQYKNNIMYLMNLPKSPE